MGLFQMYCMRGRLVASLTRIQFDRIACLLHSFAVRSCSCYMDLNFEGKRRTTVSRLVIWKVRNAPQQCISIVSPLARCACNSKNSA